MVYSKPNEVLKPQPALIVKTVRGREALSPVKRHVLGIFNDENQFIIKRGKELVIVEVPKA
jgi:hypothetical protein